MTIGDSFSRASVARPEEGFVEGSAKREAVVVGIESHSPKIRLSPLSKRREEGDWDCGGRNQATTTLIDLLSLSLSLQMKSEKDDYGAIGARCLPSPPQARSPGIHGTIGDLAGAVTGPATPLL
ncbi:hypothetical protein CRG98_021645 [Punica granatum]|uniref:Uncharacterized protein n=1 Tax=Punica granatum TaxID=22663 RepID=A0A2I0JPZ8_PUNGR|nr:hypothetical protein CRG98_021645 [Punica granatum]